MHPSWHPDPTGRHELRYWDGSAWTDHVADRGVQAMDALIPQPDPQSVQQQPVQEQPVQQPDQQVGHQATQQATQQSARHVESESIGQPDEQSGSRSDDATRVAVASATPPASPPSGRPSEQQSPAPDPAAVAAQGFSGDAFAGISGDLIDGRFSEKRGGGVELQNSRMLRVRVTEPFMARQGSMVAYQGNVVFTYQGGGAAKFLKKAFTGEGLSLMRVEGAGDVFLADQSHHVHILHLRETGLSINGTSVLAFSAGLDWNIERVKGGSIATGGLFNTTVRGTGWVAITTDGEPVVLNAGEAPTFADADAVVAWSAHLQTSLRSTMSAGSLIGRGSGEALQVTFNGQGFVIVQPSEGPTVPPHTH